LRAGLGRKRPPDGRETADSIGAEILMARLYGALGADRKGWAASPAQMVESAI
jgi:hypothetical protein